MRQFGAASAGFAEVLVLVQIRHAFTAKRSYARTNAVGPVDQTRDAARRSPNVLMSDITNGGATPLLEKTLAFTAARQKMLATNIANITTPGYRAKQLDADAFQKALRDASQKRRVTGGSLELSGSKEFRTDSSGLLNVTPSEEPAENLLFQDGTNARIERQMALLAENAMVNQAAAELLKGSFHGIEKAIRGRAV